MRPSCTPCREAGWKCPQYGDTIDRLFQNQTSFNFAALENPGDAKAYNRPPVPETHLPLRTIESKAATTPKSRAVPASQPALAHMSSSTRISPVIVPPVRDRALCMFLSNHILPNSTSPRGYFEYLSTLCTEQRANEQLYHSVTSVALAAYANSVRSSEIMKDARQHLVAAIHLVNIALSSHEEATQDHTVISIMLLSTFETITCRNQQSLVDCDLHLRGATTIISLRGHRQLQSTSGLQLFLQMCSNVLLGCLQRSVRVPEPILKLRVEAKTFLEKDDPAWQLSEIVVQLAEFRARIKEKSLLESSTIINIALEIDLRLCALSLGMPTPWKFDTVSTQTEPEFVYDGCYHIYPDVWVAHIWNSIRTSRLILHQEILGQISSQPLISVMHEIQYQNSKEVLQQMSSEICATIPQYTGHLPLLSYSYNRSLSNVQPQIADVSPEIIPLAVGIYFLLWPLLNAGQATDSSRQRAWIVNRLRYIGETTGILQAFLVADTLERREQVVVWNKSIEESRDVD